MSPLTRRLGTFLLQAGVDPRRLLASLRSFPSHLLGMVRLLRSSRAGRGHFPFRWVPALSDRHVASGEASGHYFHQDLWAARRIYAVQPERHIDIGSRIDGFIAHLLVFREVEVLDIRALNRRVAGLTFHQADLMKGPPADVGSADSLSCLHALEHFGLGRYGDAIDYDGWYSGLRSLAQMLRPAGRLYLSVPVGPQVLEYNAQRIFAPATVIAAAAELGLQLIEFSLVDDDGAFHEHCDPKQADHCQYGCGCFVFRRVA